MTHLPQCPGGSVLRCIFNLIDSDSNGIITLPKFIDFALRELKPCKVDSHCIQEIFHSMEYSKRECLNVQQFEDFLTDFMTPLKDNKTADSCSHPKGILTLEESLKVYIKQQTHAHEKAKAGDITYCPTRIPSDSGGLLYRHRLILRLLSGRIDADAAAILDFWFPENATEALLLWFGGGSALDQEIRFKFGVLVDKAAKGDLDSWTNTPLECLALIILLDQFSRNLFRNQKRMYANDEKARAVCAKALHNDYLQYLTPVQAIFLPCLVFIHSELFHHQELSINIWCHQIQNHLPQDDQLRMFGMIFLYHIKVLCKFDRLPHRNNVLGRESTKEEKEFNNDEYLVFDFPLRSSSDGRIIFVETPAFSSNLRQRPRPPLQTRQIFFDAADDAAAKRLMLRQMREWLTALASLFPDADEIIRRKTGKAVAVVTRRPENCVAEGECPEIRFDYDKEPKGDETKTNAESKGNRSEANGSKAKVESEADGSKANKE